MVCSGCGARVAVPGVDVLILDVPTVDASREAVGPPLKRGASDQRGALASKASTRPDLRDLFGGKSRFGDFLASPAGIATNILAARLQGLQSGGLVATEPCTGRAGALRYRLTPRGMALLPVLAALKDWGLAHIPGTEARIRVTAPSKKSTKGR